MRFICLFIVEHFPREEQRMSSLFHKILTNTMDFLNQINFSGIEYYEPVNMLDAFIVLASIV